MTERFFIDNRRNWQPDWKKAVLPYFLREKPPLKRGDEYYPFLLTAISTM